MKLKFITDTDKGIEFEAGYFTGHFENDKETLFSFSISPGGVDFKHYYNGYSNYFTWAVSLWLDNEEEAYKQIRRKANQLKGKQEAVYELESYLKEFVEANNPLSQSSMFSDILNHALAWVNWREIAENILSE